MAKAPLNSNNVPTGWFGVYTNLAAIADWFVTNSPADGTVNVETIATGVIGDVFIMMGESPTEVIKTYQETIIGTPALPPYWALGWSHGRWGYNQTDTIMNVVMGYRNQSIPLETIYLYIDYMRDYESFTVNSDGAFTNLNSLAEDLHMNGQRLVPFISAGIHVLDSYETYTDGKNKDIFIRNVAGDIVIGEGWGGDIVFPDWFDPKTTDYWNYWISKFFD